MFLVFYTWRNRTKITEEFRLGWDCCPNPNHMAMWGPKKTMAAMAIYKILVFGWISRDYYSIKFIVPWCFFQKVFNTVDYHVFFFRAPICLLFFPPNQLVSGEDGEDTSCRNASIPPGAIGQWKIVFGKVPKIEWLSHSFCCWISMDRAMKLRTLRSASAKALMRVDGQVQPLFLTLILRQPFLSAAHSVTGWTTRILLSLSLRETMDFSSATILIHHGEVGC